MADQCGLIEGTIFPIKKKSNVQKIMQKWEFTTLHGFEGKMLAESYIDLENIHRRREGVKGDSIFLCVLPHLLNCSPHV